MVQIVHEEKKFYDRTDWPEGPWMSEPDYKEWVEEDVPHAGYKCLVRRAGKGHLCGYVSVPFGHPWYGMPQSVLFRQVQAHRGISHSGRLPGVNGDWWWVGFDCAHLFEQSPLSDSFGGVYQTWAYVEEQVQSLLQQALKRHPHKG